VKAFGCASPCGSSKETDWVKKEDRSRNECQPWRSSSANGQVEDALLVNHQVPDKLQLSKTALFRICV
jgi:hypothetical protein